MATGTKPRTGRSTNGRPVPTFDHLTKKTPLELRDWIPLDDNATEAVEDARREHGAAELLGDRDRIEASSKALRAAIEAARDNSVEVIFRAVPRHVYEDLQRQCPPTDEEIADFKKQFGAQAMPEYDAEKFAPLIIAASCVQPEMTPEQVASLTTEHGWSAGEYAHLFQLAIRVNSSRRTVSLDF